LQRARELAARLPAINGSAWIELVELAPDEPSTVPPEVKRPGAAERARRATVARAALVHEPRSLLSDYLDLALACEDRASRDAIDRDAVLRATGNAPAIRYRLAFCSVMIAQDIGTIREADPRWTEILWFEGRRFIAVQDIWKARGKLEEAAAAMPESPAVLLTFAGVQQALSQLEPSVTTFDAVIAKVPTLRTALLGRVVSLSYLKRHEDAIQGATTMIELGAPSIGEAHYWRAFNHYSLKALDPARADADRAVQLWANTSVYTLAGLIYYDLTQLDVAQKHFEQAWRMDNTNCTANWYLGVVHADRAEWAISARTFATGVGCFTQAAAAARRDLDAVEQLEAPEDYKAAQAERHRKSIAENELRSAQSAYNAAQGFARTGDRASARSYVEVAAGHPGVKEQADKLLKAVSQ
jgi:tetratricopeptide (TPR) repeat protein